MGAGLLRGRLISTGEKRMARTVLCELKVDEPALVLRFNPNGSDFGLSFHSGWQ